MAALNKVMLIGNLTRDPEVRYTPKGSAVSDLSLAVNRSYTVDGGERMEETTYVDIVVWAKLAELAGQYLSKGRRVFVEGRLQMDSWEDRQTGQKRTKLRVVAENLQFLDSKGDREGGGGGGGGGDRGGYSQRPPQRQGSGGGGGSRPAPQRQAPNDDYGDGPITDDMEEDDIPF